MKEFIPYRLLRQKTLINRFCFLILSQDIYVPDERSELVPWGLCLHNDSPSLAGRIDPSKLRCLHPRVSKEDCRRLRIPSVSQVGTRVVPHKLFCIKVLDIRLTFFLRGSVFPYLSCRATSLKKLRCGIDLRLFAWPLGNY